MMTASHIRRRWLTGLVVGLAFGVGTLVGGTVIGALGIVSVALLAAGPPRAAGLGATLLGFGGAWFALLLSAEGRCGPGCEYPFLGPWLLIAGAAVTIGLALTWAAWWAR